MANNKMANNTVSLIFSILIAFAIYRLDVENSYQNLIENPISGSDGRWHLLTGNITARGSNLGGKPLLTQCIDPNGTITDMVMNSNAILETGFHSKGRSVILGLGLDSKIFDVKNQTRCGLRPKPILPLIADATGANVGLECPGCRGIVIVENKEEVIIFGKKIWYGGPTLNLNLLQVKDMCPLSRRAQFLDFIYDKHYGIFVLNADTIAVLIMVFIILPIITHDTQGSITILSTIITSILMVVTKNVLNAYDTDWLNTVEVDTYNFLSNHVK